MNKLFKTFYLIGFITPSSMAYAYDVNEQFSVNGYMSQGVMYTPDNTFLGMDDISFDVRGLGLNANYEVNDRLRLSGHVLVKKAGDVMDGDPKLHFLLADYLFHTSAEGDLGVRLGRVQNQYGIYNATRFVPNTRPGIIVPSSVYYDASFRELMMSTDGVNLYGRTNNDLGSFELNVYAGTREVENEAFELFIFKKKTPGDFKESAIRGLKLDFIPNSEHDLVFNYSMVNFNSDLENTPTFTEDQITAAQSLIADDPRIRSNYVTSFDTDILIHLFSMQYGVDNWLLTAEYARAHSEFTDVEILYDEKPSQSFDSEAYYLQAEYLGWHDVTVYARLDYMYLDTDDRDGQTAYSEGRLPVNYMSYGRGQTIGVRWFILPDLTLSAQYSLNEGTAWLPPSPGVKPAQFVENWSWSSVRLTYEF
ncbi:MAG: hypothetical protein U9R28_08295 [Pseudomonadota bacterium]|nr:hypothetical protein [Pseudomonadota bacterium]